MTKLTYEYCKDIASNYKTRNEFSINGHISVWQKIKKNKWDELISHIPLLTQWTYDKCKVEVSKMTYLSELQGHSVLLAMKRNGWFDELTSHLIRQQHSPYTIKEIQLEAKKYNKRSDFQTHSKGAYLSALRKGILDDVCKHMERSSHLPKYTREECIKSARKYKNRQEWILGDKGTYTTAYGRSQKSNSFFDECTAHMDYVFKPNGYWTKERCKVIADKYTTFLDFMNSNDEYVYQAINRNGWSDELCGHMSRSKKPNGYYSLNHDRCLTEASKYKTRSELKKNCGGAYSAILENKWQSSCFKHMVRKMTMKHRHIYACVFENSKTVYVGLTCDVTRRKRAHMGCENRYGKKSTVYNYMIKNNEPFVFKLLTRRPVLERNAGDREQFYIDKYKNDGWSLLNKAPGGSLGGIRRKWTREVYLKLKDGCTTREEYYKKLSYDARRTAKKAGWWDEIMEGLIHTKRHPGECWNITECTLESKKYKTRSEFHKKCSGGYKFAKKMDILITLFPKDGRS